eukprot:3941418-Rhodomonas_salina.3
MRKVGVLLLLARVFTVGGVIRSCKEGYSQQLGHHTVLESIAGKGGGTIYASCDVCGDLCDSEDTCLAYECDYQTSRCYLSTYPYPNIPPSGDYFRCVKEDLCVPGYKMYYGDFPGWGQINSKPPVDVGIVSDCSVCGQWCEEEPSCYVSQGCQHKSGTCWRRMTISALTFWSVCVCSRMSARVSTCSAL